MFTLPAELEKRLTRLAQQRGVGVENLVESLLTPVLSREEMRGQHFGIDDIVTPLRAEILAVARQRHAFNVRVFGSVARGEATIDSDIDFLVDFLPGSTLWDRIGLEQDLAELLNWPVDVSTPQTLRTETRDDILAEAVSL
jgi:predicted nucleotidyltransferase